ncbi:uncharacterized protein LOC134008754 [Osmerus eperlanus]|uniref:uncharacterized protein LOC134008752 n=1 Tax=Osmerus eperlanus TaxID=29151 RepID=UPI002E145C5E
MSGFPEKKQVDKRKAERKQAEKSWPQRLAEHRWAQQMQAAQKDAERRFIIKRWVEQRKALQKPPAQRLAELKEAEKKQADERQAEQRWKEWRQKQRAQWELEQRREEEVNTSKKKRDPQETRTPHTQVLKSPTILEELKMMDDLLEETADIKLPSMSPIHQPVSPTTPLLPLGKDGTSYMGLTTKPLEAKARHSHGDQQPTCTPLPRATHSCIPPLANQGLQLSENTSNEETSEEDTFDEERSPYHTSEFVETLPLACERSSVQQQKSLLCLRSAAQTKTAERLDYGRIILRDEGKEEERSESGLPKMQVRDPSIEERLNREMLKKMEKEVKAEKGKPAKKERELIEKQKKAEKQAQEKMEKKQKKQLEQAEKRNMEIKIKLEKEKRKMKDLERKEMQRLAEEERKELKKKEKEEKKGELGRLEMDSRPKCCGFFEKVKRAFNLI